MSSPIQTLFALLAAAYLLTGCHSTPAKPTKEEPAIELLSDGSILFHGKSIEAADLPRKLKSRGYKPGEPVLITVPSDATTASLSQLSGSLASAGFRRPVFRKERHAAAYVNPIKK